MDDTEKPTGDSERDGAELVMNYAGLRPAHQAAVNRELRHPALAERHTPNSFEPYGLD